MRVPVKFYINKVFSYMEGKESKTSCNLLEAISANEEEIEISPVVLGSICNTSAMYKAISEIMQEYASKQEIEEFLSMYGSLMKGDCFEAYRDLKLHLFIMDDLRV